MKTKMLKLSVIIIILLFLGTSLTVWRENSQVTSPIGLTNGNKIVPFAQSNNFLYPHGWSTITAVAIGNGELFIAGYDGSGGVLLGSYNLSIYNFTNLTSLVPSEASGIQSMAYANNQLMLTGATKNNQGGFAAVYYPSSNLIADITSKVSSAFGSEGGIGVTAWTGSSFLLAGWSYTTSPLGFYYPENGTFKQLVTSISPFATNTYAWNGQQFLLGGAMPGYEGREPGTPPFLGMLSPGGSFVNLNPKVPSWIGIISHVAYDNGGYLMSGVYSAYEAQFVAYYNSNGTFQNISSDFSNLNVKGIMANGSQFLVYGSSSNNQALLETYNTQTNAASSKNNLLPSGATSLTAAVNSDGYVTLGGSSTSGAFITILSGGSIYKEKYTVNFSESGLPSGTTWYVNLSNDQSFSSTNSTTISFSEPNGTYNYTIATTDKNYKTSPSSGSFTVNGKSLSMNAIFHGSTFILAYSSYRNYFLSNISFNETIGISSEFNGTTPLSVEAVIDNSTFNLAPTSSFWNLTINTGIFHNNTNIRIMAHFPANHNLSLNYTVRILNTPDWLSGLFAMGIVSIAEHKGGEWNNPYTVSDVVNLNFASIFSQSVGLGSLFAENFSFIPSIDLGILFNSTGNLSLFGSFVASYPSIGIGTIGLGIGGTVKVQGDFNIANDTINWISASLNLKIQGDVSANIPTPIGDTFNVFGHNLTIGLSMTISVSPYFVVNMIFEPTLNSSSEIVQNIGIALQKITSAISIPITAQINAGIGFASVSGGGTLTFNMNLQNGSPFDKGGNLTGELFIKYSMLFWSGTIYSIGPGTLYSWGNMSGMVKDPASNLTMMSRYFNVTGYDSLVWGNSSISGTAVHDIYPQTSVSSVTYGDHTFIFYSSDNVSKQVNRSLDIQALEFSDSDRSMQEFNLPSVSNEITLNPYATELNNGSILLMWTAIPYGELSSNSPFTTDNMTLQYTFYNVSTGMWSPVMNLTNGKVMDSYKVSVSGNSIYAAVLWQHTLLSSSGNVSFYSLPENKELSSIMISNGSRIETFNYANNVLSVQYYNGSVQLMGITGLREVYPIEAGYTLTSMGLVMNRENFQYLLYTSKSGDRLIISNLTSGKIIQNITLNVTVFKVSVFYAHDSLYLLYAESPYTYVYNISSNSLAEGLSYNLGDIYSIGISSSGSYSVMWSLTNYGNLTNPLLNLNITEVGSFYRVNFIETGLSSGTTWYVNMSNGMSSGPITGSSYSFTVTNDTYSYTIATADKTYEASSSSGSFKVNGSSVPESITFSPVKYTVSFAESGLPSGTTWYVNLSNGMDSGAITGMSYSFALTNGTYSYSVSSISGYLITNGSGSLSVNGGNVANAVNFTKPSSPGIYNLELYSIIGGVAVVATIVSLFVIMRKRR